MRHVVHQLRAVASELANLGELHAASLPELTVGLNIVALPGKDDDEMQRVAGLNFIADALLSAATEPHQTSAGWHASASGYPRCCGDVHRGAGVRVDVSGPIADPHEAARLREIALLRHQIAELGRRLAELEQPVNKVAGPAAAGVFVPSCHRCGFVDGYGPDGACPRCKARKG